VKKAFLLLPFCLLSSLAGFSQDKNFKNEFGFRTDNDAYLAYGQDRYYTNGLFIRFRHAMKQNPEHARLAKKIWEAEAGQYMYNPYSGSTDNIQNVDRPYAAYLYGGFKMSWFKTNEDVFNVSVQAGTIGPRALGKEAQETLHSVVGFYKITGWQYQVKNEPGLNTSVDYSHLLARTGRDADIIFQSYAKLGNTFSGAGISALLRAGSINDLIHSASSNGRISNSIRDTMPSKEFFFFARPSLHFVGYNATIQGPLFSDDKGPVTYDPKRLLFSQELGVMYAKKRWTVDFSLTFQSREIETQFKSHQYGSIGMYYRFN